MTRKKYIKKMQHLVLAIIKDPDSTFPEGFRTGDRLKEIKRNSPKLAIQNFGSYDNAWNCDAIVWCRKHYLSK